MKVLDFLEHNPTVYNLSQSDITKILKEVNLEEYCLLSTACSCWINPIEDDRAFCDAEWNFMQYWFHNKGFTENDYRYVEACGYERDQFRKEVI